MIAIIDREGLVLRLLTIIELWTALALGGPSNLGGRPGHTPNLRKLADGSFEISTPRLSVRVDSDMRVTPNLISPSGRESLIINGRSGEKSRPQQYVKVAGSLVTSFSQDAGHSVALEGIETVHGRGKRFRMWATAEAQRGCRLRKTVTIDIYERYPRTVLFQTRYANVSNAAEQIETYYEASLRLDGSDLWAFHPRHWIWGEDFLFPIKPGVELKGSNIAVSKQKGDYRILGGGLPAVCFISPRITLTLGCLAPRMKMLRFPVRADSNGVSVGVKNDGHTVPLPCFNPAHTHEYPEQSVEDYPLMQKTVYEAFARLKPEGFVVAFCFDGVMPFFYHHHYTTRPWPNADPASEKQARWKQKLYKVIFGPRRVLLDDHSDVKYLSGRHGTWYLGPVSGLAMGSILETAIGPGYDYKSHHYDDIFSAYHREMLPEGGEYLNLYNVIHDKPECHVVRKDGKLYFGFFAEKFAATIELRGLKDGTRYRVVDYLHGHEYPDVNAAGTTARLDTQFDSYLLLRLNAVP